MEKLVLGLLICLLVTSSAYSKIDKKLHLPIYHSTKSYDLKNDLGKKYIVLNFWASWCVACIGEIPVLNKLHNKHKSGQVVFLGVNAGEKDKKIAKFLKKHTFNFLILKDEQRILSKSWGVDKLPRTIIIDKNQKIIYNSDTPPPLEFSFN
jgi:thiol-disulfide isomerase/thioredoxin